MSSAGTPQAPAGRGIKPLDSLHRHARLVVLIFPLIVMLGLPLVFIQGQPSYQSTGTIQVSPRYMKTLRDDIELEFQSNTQFLQFIQQQARTVNRYDVLELALQRLDQAGHDYWRRDGESERKRIERLQQSLSIRHVRDTYLVQVTLTADRPDGLAELVNAVIAAYLERARQEQVYAAEERVASLRQRESDLLSQIQSMTSQRTVIGQTLGVTAFNPDEVNAFDRQVRQLNEDLLEARQARIRAESRLNAFLEQRESDTELRSIQESILTDPGLNSLKASLNQRRAELLSNTAGMAPNHPARLDAEDELAAIDAEIESREQTLRNHLIAGMEQRHRASTLQARSVEQQLAEMLAEFDTRAARYAEQFNQAVSLNHHLGLLWSELDQVRDRLNFFAAEETSPGFSRLVTTALPPLYPTGTGKKRLLALLLIAAMGISLALPMAIDFLNPRIRTVADAHRALGFAPTGWLIEADSPAHERLATDQLRRLASSLIRDHERNGTRIIVLSSARPGGGTTWLVRRLAKTLQALGYPTLAVEANAYRPDAVYGPGPGLVQWLAGDLEQAPVIEGSAMSTLPSGLEQGSQGLPLLERLPGLLRSLPERHRFIIVDAPPLLTHADAELIAGAGDAVLLVAEAEAVQRGELQRAGRLLQAIDPAVVGSVVNRIRPFLGGGYVGSLAEEHQRGHKLDASGMVQALRITLTALLRAPLELMSDLTGLVRRNRGRRADQCGPA
ncbi:MAG: hypothetical protein EA370_06485 [Wenzhouxiangella sp.]|nr:MAG: hypothetical protein EA370_06485 [Wenzhouxiangella sp.]